MANQILIRGGALANLPAALPTREPYWTTDTEQFYIGTGTGRKLINPSGVPATTADKLSTARQIAISGAATGATLFDGSQSVEIALALANSGVTAGTYTKITVNAKGIVTAAEQVTAADVSGLLTGGKIDPALLPAIALTEVFTVSTQAEMLALTAQPGDVAIRSDVNKSFILKAAPASTLANWVELLAPTGGVLSVNGKTGAVTVNAADVGLGNVTNESKATMFSSPTFTGEPTAPTPATADSSQKVATTAFVKNQNYIAPGDIIDGGTF